MRLYIETLGCPKNFNDSEGVAGIWEQAGNRLTDNPAEADVILVNTCGFINDAKKESIDRIFDMARFIEEAADKSPKGKKILAVSGCLSQRYGGELFQEMPEVDLFLGVNDYERLPDLARQAQRGRQAAFSSAPGGFWEFPARKIGENPYSATLRIAEGCDNCCAYCVIPQIRGGYRSRPMENILEEAENLAAAGCKELVLIAQDVTEYGRDLYGALKLPELLRMLCKIEGIRWIRLMYCYEDKITRELMETMASEEKICKYIDIPLQHVSDHVLSAMNRRSTESSIRRTIARLREMMPDIHIRTTLICGFPGEREEDFEALLDFVEETRFQRLGVFAYSREEGTVAGEMEDQIDEEIKAMRTDAIMRRQVDISREINEAKVGNTMEVLTESQEEDGSYMGRSCYDAPEIDNTVLFQSDRQLMPGDLVKVRITDAFDYDLVGRTEE